MTNDANRERRDALMNAAARFDAATCARPRLDEILQMGSFELTCLDTDAVLKFDHNDESYIVCMATLATDVYETVFRSDRLTDAYEYFRRLWVDAN